METTKFCSACLYCRPAKDQEGLMQFKFARCARPTDEPVDGYDLTHPDLYRREGNHCRVERMTDNLCGRNAKFFTPAQDGPDAVR